MVPTHVQLWLQWYILEQVQSSGIIIVQLICKNKGPLCCRYFGIMSSFMAAIYYFNSTVYPTALHVRSPRHINLSIAGADSNLYNRPFPGFAANNAT